MAKNQILEAFQEKLQPKGEEKGFTHLALEKLAKDLGREAIPLGKGSNTPPNARLLLKALDLGNGVEEQLSSGIDAWEKTKKGEKLEGIAKQTKEIITILREKLLTQLQTTQSVDETKQEIEMKQKKTLLNGVEKLGEDIWDSDFSTKVLGVTAIVVAWQSLKFFKKTAVGEAIWGFGKYASGALGVGLAIEMVNFAQAKIRDSNYKPLGWMGIFTPTSVEASEFAMFQDKMHDDVDLEKVCDNLKVPYDCLLPLYKTPISKCYEALQKANTPRNNHLGRIKAKEDLGIDIPKKYRDSEKGKKLFEEELYKSINNLFRGRSLEEIKKNEKFKDDSSYGFALTQESLDSTREAMEEKESITSEFLHALGDITGDAFLDTITIKPIRDGISFVVDNLKDGVVFIYDKAKARWYVEGEEENQTTQANEIIKQAIRKS